MNAQAFGILVRLWMWAVAVRLLKRRLPLPTLVGLSRAYPRAPRPLGAFERTLERYLLRRHRFPFRAPGNCLERSIGAYRLLGARGRRPELRVGMAPGLRGHVWVEVDGRPFGEREGDLDGLTLMLAFDDRARQHRTGQVTGEELARLRVI